MTNKSKTITVGNLRLGGNNPIRLQSMTNTNTMDTKATVEQSIRMIDTGAELIRITAPGIREARNIALIKKSLQQKGYDVPLIADIHFNPKAAEEAAAVVEKVRINPGNYAGRTPKGKQHFTDEEYRWDLEKIKTRIAPLIGICKTNGTAMRVGSNHGSLSPRIMDRFGDTPEGMATSVMEFCRICDELDFHNIVVSMKSSNTRVMVQATRLLVRMLKEEGFNYPVHLGVTEAGGGLEGRVKSASGIGTLLQEGIGDTIRVSLTEAPENELPVAAKIVDTAAQTREQSLDLPLPGGPFRFSRRQTLPVGNIGGTFPPVVIQTEDEAGNSHGFADYWFSEKSASENFLQPYESWKSNPKGFPVFTTHQLTKKAEFHSRLNFVKVNSKADLKTSTEYLLQKPFVLILNGTPAEIAGMLHFLDAKKQENPVIIHYRSASKNQEDFAIEAAATFGTFFLNGLADGLWIENANIPGLNVSEFMFTLLQATRSRITRTEFIACPSCGRTLFDIEKTLAAVKAKTSHLKGLKIAVMGCIVNGPGEMADADYGYVGAGPGKVTLYKGQTVKKKNIPEKEAIDELVALIKEEGDWVANDS